MSEIIAETETRTSRLVRRLAVLWALAGGVVLLGVVLMHTWSVIGNQFGLPFPGDFELTEIGVAIAAFSFLPYCQITGANVTADIFTSRASPRFIAICSLAGSLVAFAFSLLLLWRMYAGMLDQREYGYETAVLQFPNWIGWIPVLVSLALLALASMVTIVKHTRRI